MIARTFSRRTLLSGGSAAFAAVGLVRSPAKPAQFELKCSADTPKENPASIRMTQMWEAVERESGGRVRVQFFPNSQLGGNAATFAQMRVGAIHFVLTSSAYLASIVPPADIGFLAFAFKDAEEGCRSMDGPLGEYIRREVAAKGMYALRSVWDFGMIQMASVSHPIRTPADLRGFKPRISGSKITIDFFKELGASPTPLELAEVYTALQTKLVDGVSAPLVSIEASRWYEVLKYISLTNHGWAADWLIANGDTWKSMPPELQDIIERKGTEFANRERKDTKLLSVSLADKLSRQGLTINRVDQSTFQTGLHSYYETWANAFGLTEWGLLQSAIGRKLI